MPYPGLKWYYNSRSGAVQEWPELYGETFLHTGTGWHGPFDTKQATLDFYTANQAANPGWKAPTGWQGNVANIPGAIVQQGEAATQSEVFKGLNLDKWLVRIGEILLGIVLIGVGIAKLTGTTNAVAGLVKTAVKVAP